MTNKTLETIAAAGIDGLDTDSGEHELDEEELALLFANAQITEVGCSWVRLSEGEWARRIAAKICPTDARARDTIREILEGAPPAEGPTLPESITNGWPEDL